MCGGGQGKHAARTGKIHVGQRVVRVNGASVEHKSRQEVSSMINAAQSTVVFHAHYEQWPAGYVVVDFLEDPGGYQSMLAIALATPREIASPANSSAQLAPRREGSNGGKSSAQLARPSPYSTPGRAGSGYGGDDGDGGEGVERGTTPATGGYVARPYPTPRSSSSRPRPVHHVLPRFLLKGPFCCVWVKYIDLVSLARPYWDHAFAPCVA